MSGMLTAAELATHLKVKSRTVLRWADAGRITVIRLGPKTLRFDPATVLQELQRKQPPATPAE